MEGTLLKWTNYWNGWQPRWFVLKEGVLSYYNSQNDTNSGCKRSFKISMFDIIVNRTDSTRMDLIVANDQHLYLKACDFRERQKWLLAIATQKANYPNSTNEQQYVYQSNNLLKCKQSELRLYCDLLMQQVHEMKGLVNVNTQTNETKKIDEITSNVNVTCEMLMNIVKNIIIITENQNQHQLTNISGVTASLLTNSNNINNNSSSNSNNNINHHHQHYSNGNNNALNTLKDLLNENISLTNTNNSNSSSNLSSPTQLKQDQQQQLFNNDNDIIAKSFTFADYFHQNERPPLSTTTISITSSKLLHNMLAHNVHLTGTSRLLLDFNNNNNYNSNNINYNYNNNFDYKKILSTYNTTTTTNRSTIDRGKSASNDNNLENYLTVYDIDNNSNKGEEEEEESIVDKNEFEMRKRDFDNDKYHNLNHNYDKNIHHHNHNHTNNNNNNQHLNNAQTDNNKTFQHRSFFTTLEHRFENLEFINDDEIPTEKFLHCCRDVFKILDIFGSTTFLPVKVDVMGNINKINQKYLSNQTKYRTLQVIVQSEIDENLTKVKNSATDALLWLKRAMWFLREFCRDFIKPNSDIYEAMQKSYSRTLKQYHNWVVRGIFSLALRSAPTKDGLYIGFSIDQNDFYNNREEFIANIECDMKRLLVVVDKILTILNSFYTSRNLDVDSPIYND